MVSNPYSKMKVKDLKAALIARGRDPPLSTVGNKATLAARLERDDKGESDALPENNIITKKQLTAAGPNNDVYKWAMEILTADSNEDPPPPVEHLGNAISHPDLQIVHTLLIEMRAARNEMAPPDPPSMMTTLEVMKDLIQNEMVDNHVFSADAHDLLLAFGVDAEIQEGDIEEATQNDFIEMYILPVKQAQIGWLSSTIRKLETEGPATKFPEHFDKKEISTLRAWAKSYIRNNDLDVSKKFTDDIFSSALVDEELNIERAKTLQLVTTILNQAASSIKRDNSQKSSRRSSAGEKGNGGGVKKGKKRKGAEESEEEEADVDMQMNTDSQDEAGPSSRGTKRRRVIDLDEDDE